MNPDHSQERGAPAQPRPGSTSGRVRAISHLVALVADAAEALEQDDLARLRELNAMRVRLVEEMRDEERDEPPSLQEMMDAVGDAVQHVQERLEREARSRSELAQLQDDSLPLVRGFRRFGSGNYLSLEPSSTRVDVRL